MTRPSDLVADGVLRARGRRGPCSRPTCPRPRCSPTRPTSPCCRTATWAACGSAAPRRASPTSRSGSPRPGRAEPAAGPSPVGCPTTRPAPSRTRCSSPPPTACSGCSTPRSTRATRTPPWCAPRTSTDGGAHLGTAARPCSPSRRRGGVFVRQPPVVLPSGRWLLPTFPASQRRARRGSGDHDTSSVLGLRRRRRHLGRARRARTRRARPHERRRPRPTARCSPSTAAAGPTTCTAAPPRRRRRPGPRRSRRSCPTTTPRPGTPARRRPRSRWSTTSASRRDAVGRRASLYDEIDDDGHRRGCRARRGRGRRTTRPRPARAFWGAPRAPLTLALSADDGATWPARRVLDDGDGYCLSNNSRDGVNRELSYPSLVQVPRRRPARRVHPPPQGDPARRRPGCARSPSCAPPWADAAGRRLVTGASSGIGRAVAAPAAGRRLAGRRPVAAAEPGPRRRRLARVRPRRTGLGRVGRRRPRAGGAASSTRPASRRAGVSPTSTPRRASACTPSTSPQPCARRSCLADRLDEGGRIVLVGSRTADGVAGKSQYAATQGGTARAGPLVGRELAERRVTVNVVEPGPTRHGDAADPRRAATPRAPCRRWAGWSARGGRRARRRSSRDGGAMVTGQHLRICGGASL